MTTKPLVTKPDLSKRFTKLIVVGEPGSGKTHFLTSAAKDPRTSPCLYFECAANPDHVVHYYGEDLPDFVTVTELETLDQPLLWLLGGQQENHPYANALRSVGYFRDNIPYKSIVIDGGSQINMQLASEKSSELGGSKSMFATGAGGVRLQSDMPKEAAGFPYYNRIVGQQNFSWFKFFNLPIHVFASFLDDDRESALTKEMRAGLLAIGQTKTSIPSYASAVGYLRLAAMIRPDVRKELGIETNPTTLANTRVLQFQATNRVHAKNAIGLESYYKNPTITDILDTRN